MDVLLIGAYGRCGTAIIDHLHEDSEFSFTYLDRTDPDADDPYGEHDTVVADVQDYDAIRPAFDGQDAVIHLAGYPYVDSSWDDVHVPNLVGIQNVLRAANEAEVESVVFASTNHVMGMYEAEFAPELYERDFDLTLTHEDPVRPDSFYGTSKVFGETLGRQYVETEAYPEQFYALRICSVRYPEYDHPYGDAERRVDGGEIERGSEAYERDVARMKAMWQSRRDFAHMVACCLRDDDVTFDIFSGVSDNDRRWFDIEHARDVINYRPRDNGETWDGPPE